MKLAAPSTKGRGGAGRRGPTPDPPEGPGTARAVDTPAVAVPATTPPQESVNRGTGMEDDDRNRRTKPPRFDGSDWWDWKNRFKPWASDQKLACFYYEPAVARPVEQGPEQERWDNRCTRAFADLVAALEPKELIHIISEFSAQTERVQSHPGAVPVEMTLPYRPREAWKALEMYYQSQQLPARLMADRELTNLRMGTGESTGSYWTRARTLRAKLLATGGYIDQLTWMGRVIAGLPVEWRSLKVVLNREFLTLTEAKLYGDLLGEEERLREESTLTAMWASGNQGGGQSSQGSSGGGQRSGSGNRWAKNKGGKGKAQQSMPEWGKRGPAPPGQCHGCHREGHMWSRCPSRPNGAVPDHMRSGNKGGSAKTAEGTSNQQRQPGELGIAVGEASLASLEQRDGWWMDSGASHNFTYCAADFHGPLQQPEVTTVRVGDGKLVTTHGMGEVIVEGYQRIRTILSTSSSVCVDAFGQ